MSANLPDASVVVINWNGRGLLADCLPSIAGLDYPRDLLEVIVFDNGSTDGSVEWLRQAWPDLCTVRSEHNLGFAAAVNKAASAGHGEVLAIVNNDLRVDRQWLRRMIDALHTTGAAVAGSRVLDWEGRRYDFDGAAMNFYGHGTSRRHGRPCGGDGSGEPTAALFACGAAMVADRGRFLASGGFDPDYFAYFEDVDLGWRLWVEGERVVYVPGAVAYHRHHGSGMGVADRTRLLERNALATLVKNYDDDHVSKVLPAALLLLEARARAAGAAENVYREAMESFLDALPSLRRKRAEVQSRRRRSDREILPLFGEPFRPSFFGRAYWKEQQRVARAFDIGSMFGQGEAMATAENMEDFISDLQARIEDLERELVSLRQAATTTQTEGARERARLDAEIERLRRELQTRSRSGLRSLLCLFRRRQFGE